MFRSKLFAILILCILFSANSGCNEVNMKSNFRTREITVDGKSKDWIGTEQIYDKDRGIKIGFINDESNLYMSVSVWNKKLQMKALRDGLMLWMEKNDTAMGIHFPMKTARRVEAGEKLTPTGDVSIMEPGRTGGNSEEIRTQMIGRMVKSADQVEVVTVEGEPGDIMLREGLKERFGCEAALDYEGGYLVYELMVPLELIGRGSGEDGGKIELKLETGEFEMLERSGMPDRSKMGERGGGFSGRPGGGGGPGGGVGMRGGPRGNREGLDNDPFKIGIKLQLVRDSMKADDNGSKD